LKNIELVGYKTGDELYNLIKHARLVVMPSIWYENNPISILEAFALGKPVVGSDLAGMRELINDKGTGFLFKPGQSADLKKLITDNYFNTELLEKMGQNCRKFVEENCSPAIHLKKILEIYQSLIK
jgi:glycosyltransferase involved in cell wall biosynthesis